MDKEHYDIGHPLKLFTRNMSLLNFLLSTVNHNLIGLGNIKRVHTSPGFIPSSCILVNNWEASCFLPTK